MNRRELLGAILALFTSQVIPEPAGRFGSIYLRRHGLYLRTFTATIEVTPEVAALAMAKKGAFVAWMEAELAR
ncbi:MAG: hypothetical protein V3R16_09625 [Nitrospirales bacterium]